LASLIVNSQCTPIIIPAPPSTAFVLPKDFCYLPPSFGSESVMKYVEDCESLDQFPTLPMPAVASQKSGTHPMVCCPKKIHESDICFPSDPWCPTYVKPDYGGDYDYPEYTPPEEPTLADKSCPGTPIGDGLVLDTCVPVHQCDGLIALAPSNAPQLVMQPCGFDEEILSLLICCPDSLISSNASSLTQAPRFPNMDGSAKSCDDKHQLCESWKEDDGCRLDRNFEIEKDDPNGFITSLSMFDFMNSACTGTCERCGDKGCVDEHPKCVEWARNGMCILNPIVMAHTCRESCGVCGFLSPASKEEQVIKGDSYSDFTRDSFDCGRFKLLTDVNPEGTDNNAPLEVKEKTPEEVAEDVINYVDLRNDDSDDIFFSSQGVLSESGDKPDIYCGATVISDRWVVAAAHCYDDLGSGSEGGPRSNRVNNIRENTVFKEIIGVKRVFVHPLYKYPNLYNDIAILELGRRIAYDWEVFGDSPSCLHQGFDAVGKIATIQGFGLTEKNTKGDLLETNVTIIDNKECKTILEEKLDGKDTERSKMKKALPQGLDYGLLCAKGERVPGTDIYKGSCRGDSGGPLTTRDEQNRVTLAGIVSGGLGCGKGYPGWYTRVEFFIDWIECIVTNGKLGGKEEDILEKCSGTVIQPKTREELSVDDYLFGDTRSDDDFLTVEEFLFGGLTVEDVRNSV